VGRRQMAADDHAEIALLKKRPWHGRGHRFDPCRAHHPVPPNRGFL